MPTNSNAYNSRVTDEALEKRFRDTFRSQGGAELVDDLYAQGVIVPVVDFTAAATGDVLSENLQTAWDFTTGATQVSGTTSTLVTNSGFWQVDLNFTGGDVLSNNPILLARVFIDDGTSTKTVWAFSSAAISAAQATVGIIENKFIVFLRSGDSLKAFSNGTTETIDIWYRQIATVNGDPINPFGFTFS